MNESLLPLLFESYCPTSHRASACKRFVDDTSTSALSPTFVLYRSSGRYQARLEGKTDLDSAAFLIVTGVWAPGSLVDSPVLYTKENGTQVRQQYSVFNIQYS